MRADEYSSDAGHADQEDTTDIEEEDGKNECECSFCLSLFRTKSLMSQPSVILTSDGLKIMDNVCTVCSQSSGADVYDL